MIRKQKSAVCSKVGAKRKEKKSVQTGCRDNEASYPNGYGGKFPRE
jgi:hypothetical protein